ncbi:MAG: flagellar hook-length control protein FliK [Acidimicrobiales bacterium]
MPNALPSAQALEATQSAAIVAQPTSVAPRESAGTNQTDIRPLSLTELPATTLDQIRGMRQSGDSQRRIVLRLDPPELGALTLELRTRGDELTVIARSQTPEAARALLRQRVEVQTAVEALGMELAGFDVQYESPDGAQQRWAQVRGGQQRTASTTPGGQESVGTHPSEGAIFL